MLYQKELYYFRLGRRGSGGCDGGRAEFFFRDFGGGKKSFLPLLQSSIVILPLLFKLCDFILVNLKRSSHLLLFCDTVRLANI